MSSTLICVFIYVNSEIIHSSSGNAIFTSDNTNQCCSIQQ